MSKVSRRGFLAALTGSALAAALARIAPSQGAAPHAESLEALGNLGRTIEAHSRDPYWGAIPLDRPYLTAVEDLYVARYSAAAIPQVDATTWRLRVDGLVEMPLSLDLEQIKAFPALRETRVLECVNNPVGGTLIGALNWGGARLSALIELVRPLNNATHVLIEAADGYSTSLPRAAIEAPGAMLAHALNDSPLDAPHGFPLRLHIPGLYGYKLPRWITRLTFIDFEYLGFWESHGWSNTGEMHTQSIILTPTAGATVPIGATIAIQGIAVTGAGHITGVEVQIDGGDWMPTLLLDAGWTQWRFPWIFTAPGSYQVAARARDDRGGIQAQTVDFGAFPRGNDAIHSIMVLAESPRRPADAAINRGTL